MYTIIIANMWLQVRDPRVDWRVRRALQGLWTRAGGAPAHQEKRGHRGLPRTGSPRRLDGEAPGKPPRIERDVLRPGRAGSAPDRRRVSGDLHAAPRPTPLPGTAGEPRRATASQHGDGRHRLHHDRRAKGPRSRRSCRHPAVPAAALGLQGSGRASDVQDHVEASGLNADTNIHCISSI